MSQAIGLFTSVQMGLSIGLKSYKIDALKFYKGMAQGLEWFEILRINKSK